MFGRLVHGLPRQGRAAREGAPAARRRPNPRQTSQTRSASRSHRCPSGSATSDLRARPAPAVAEPPPAPAAPREARRDRRLRSLAGSNASACSPTRHSSPRALPCYAGEGAKRDGQCRSRTRTRRWSASSVRGCVASSTSMRRACAFASTCTRASISTPPRVLVRGHRRPALAVPGAVPGQGRSDDALEQARARLRLRRLLLLAHASRVMGLVRALLSSSAIPG